MEVHGAGTTLPQHGEPGRRGDLARRLDVDQAALAHQRPGRRERGIEQLGGLTPRAIRTHLGLNKPIYAKTAAYGHFGRKAEGDLFPWERIDLVDALKAKLGA